MKSVASLFVTAAFRFYRQALSPLKPRSCRYYPSCSAYAIDAVERYGAVKGAYMAAKRIVRCNPLHPGGFDPVL